MKSTTKKRGWLTLAIVLVAISGYLIYKYAYLVYQDYDYYAYYEDIHSLQIANPVYVSGVKVGEVSNIRLNGDQKVRVTLSIDKKTKLPLGTTAVLASNNLRGDKMVFLEIGKGPGIHNHKNVLFSKYDTTVMDMSDQVAPIVESAKYILNTADKNFSAFNRKLDNGWATQAQKDIRNVEQRMHGYGSQLSGIQANATEIISTIKKLKQATNNAAADRQKLSSAIKNAEAQTASWSSAPVNAEMDSLRMSTKNVQTKATELENSDAGKEMLEKDKMYTDLNKAAVNLNETLVEMKNDADE
jgi:ABC-type transporter Mla subunit MlaD